MYVHMQMKNVLSSFRHMQFVAPKKLKVACIDEATVAFFSMKSPKYFLRTLHHQYQSIIYL